MSPRPRVLVPPAELQIEILTTPDTYETEAQGGAYMDRNLAEWARAFAWDARRTITQTYEGRISQAMSSQTSSRKDSPETSSPGISTPSKLRPPS